MQKLNVAEKILSVLDAHDKISSEEIRQYLWIEHKQGVSMTYLRTQLLSLRKAGEIERKPSIINGLHSYRYTK